MDFTDQERAEIAIEQKAIAARLWPLVEKAEKGDNFDLAIRLRAQACDAEDLVHAAQIPDARRSNALLARIY
ncbi:hypothetical protein [Streptomyces sp. NPDC015125]|uniref:hypothetical protein n=1 Tax=Streptomyces sp. NPDC015125 TaxID=3364938 RepID=UPI0036FE3C2C